MNKDLPLITIIIPLYNVESFVVNCLQSVISQTYAGEIECLVIDDCGTDDSVTIVEQFIQNYSGKVEIRLLHHNYNKGLSAARNTGLDAAMGKYVYFLDSDDWLNVDAIQDLYNAITSGDYAVAVSYFTANINGGPDSIYRGDWIFDEPRVIEPAHYAERFILEKSNHAATAKLYKKEFFEEVRFREGKCNEDSLFIIDSSYMVEKNKFRCIEIPRYSYHYRIREDGICKGKDSSFKFDSMQNIEFAIAYYKNNKEMVELLKAKLKPFVIYVVRHKPRKKEWYFAACKSIKSFTNEELKDSRTIIVPNF